MENLKNKIKKKKRCDLLKDFSCGISCTEWVILYGKPLNNVIYITKLKCNLTPR